MKKKKKEIDLSFIEELDMSEVEYAIRYNSHCWFCGVLKNAGSLCCPRCWDTFREIEKIIKCQK